MDVNNRKTALDEDSILYQRHNDESTKKDVKALDGKGKFKYFVDYYLLKIVIGLAVLIICGNLFYNAIFHHAQTILTINAIGDVFLEDPELLAQDLRPIFGLTNPDDNIYVTNYYLSDYNQQMAFTTHLAAGEIDVMLFDKEQFLRYSEQGICANLSEVLDPALFDELKDQIVEGRQAVYDSQSDTTTYKDPYPMAIDVTGNPFFEKYTPYDGEIYLSLFTGSERVEQELLFLDYFFHPEHFSNADTQE